jgi:hypothetical protein
MIRVTNTETFIAKAKTIHGDIYNYDKAVYAGPRNKLVITCKTHGDFERTPENHYTGQGCKECGIVKRSANKIQRHKETFINRADLIHNNKYSYEKVEYTFSKTKVTITCPIHGDFEQEPNSHIQGKGCPYCAEIDKQLRNSNKDSIVYYIKTADSEGNSVWKIGITSTSVGEIFHGLLKRSSYTFLANL